MIAHIQRHPSGPRLFIGGYRLHHGTSGCALAIASILARHPRLALVGLALAAHDWHDRRVWLRLECLPSPLTPSEPLTLP